MLGPTLPSTKHHQHLLAANPYQQTPRQQSTHALLLLKALKAHLRPSSLRPYSPGTLPKLHQLTQSSHKHSIEPKQRQIQQITTAALEPESRAPALQQLQAFARIVDDFGADEQVQEERRDEREVCAGI